MPKTDDIAIIKVTKWTLGNQNRRVVRFELQIEACITETGTEVKPFFREKKLVFVFKQFHENAIG